MPVLHRRRNRPSLDARMVTLFLTITVALTPLTFVHGRVGPDKFAGTHPAMSCLGKDGRRERPPTASANVDTSQLRQGRPTLECSESRPHVQTLVRNRPSASPPTFQVEEGRRPSGPAHQEATKRLRPATVTHGIRRSSDLIALQPLLPLAFAVLVTPLVQ